ncbi:hypothetical protein [Microvirga sp. BSC39]|uniref:hypothetical protein n=1 Tax=Microvirga sp. BSC39 TaxID=1549810 RepID=UPI0004E95DF5|nr:hypothetical protein [Microvirga sp. BSC39]KFG68068.1 hypothetical protein JH26_19345 [Microvirga sp. BSC39]
MVLADAPVAALDRRHRLIVPEARAGAAVAILHDLNLAARFADRIVLPDQGKVGASSPVEAVLTEARLAVSLGIRAWGARRRGAFWRWPRTLYPAREGLALEASLVGQGYIDKGVSPSDTPGQQTAGP